LFVDDPLSSDDSEAFISQLESGENATLRFRLAADGSAIPKGYPLLVDFAYEDTRGEQQLSDTYYISATVAESEAAELPVSPPIIALALAAVVLVVGIVVWLRRRSR
jgi:hypothetical protein